MSERVDTRPGTKRGSAEWRARISRSKREKHLRDRERELELAAISPRHLKALRKGIVSPSLEWLLPLAEEEGCELVAALGGPEEITPQRRAIIEDAVSLGMVLRAELGRYLQSRDVEAAARVSSLANARRAALTAVGLDRIAKQLDPTAALSVTWRQTEAGAAEDTPERANGAAPDPTPSPSENSVHSGDLSAEPRR